MGSEKFQETIEGEVRLIEFLPSVSWLQILICHLFKVFVLTAMVLFVCFVALRHKSTATVIVGQSVHLTTPFPGQA